MRILLINSPHPAIGSRIPHEHLPPLGLLYVGGSLIDAGHHVQLLDAEFGPMPAAEIIRQVLVAQPDTVLLGHSGSTSAHPIIMELTRLIRQKLPDASIIYGGVFPTYHWKDILSVEPQIDVIVRGEGEETIVKLIQAIEMKTPLKNIPGLAYRDNGLPVSTPDAAPIEDLDKIRIGWELIDPKRYSYWGDKRAVVVQFSRGCPHSCNYCGQHLFWIKWRHRDPQKFAAEIAGLHRTYGIEVFNLADENPTASRPAWKAFLEALIGEKVTVTIIGSTRADDIVRDADLLPLYKQAGVARFLLGMESYDEQTLRKINKGSAIAKDREAIRLLRQNGIISMATYVVGFEEERNADYWRSLKQLLSYDPDQIQLLYATPHRWTPYARLEAERRVIQPDQRKWDYKHQVLATRHLPSWRVLLWVKFIEAVMQLRPRALLRVLAHSHPAFKDAMRWYYRIGRKVWPYEIWNFFFRDQQQQNGPTVAEYWNMQPNAKETSFEHLLIKDGKTEVY
jgi:anaerobic magnesium-protoporphyrin IX monomethyl ester cyclase